ncbi:hypothetical protein IM538_12625 [Cytobacillus suaedae]|nr:hypothetical protein IM538_12625 [Cytobacillus suaedae]
MSTNRWLLFGVMLLPWLSIPLLGNKYIKRFLPATIFITSFVHFEGLYAERRKWWWFFERLHPKMNGMTPFLLGPFTVGTLWILRFTFGNFLLFIVTNFLVHLAFVFPLLNWLTKIGIGSLIRFNRMQLLALFTFKSALLYVFQMFVEKLKNISRDNNQYHSTTE